MTNIRKFLSLQNSPISILITFLYLYLLTVHRSCSFLGPLGNMTRISERAHDWAVVVPWVWFWFPPLHTLFILLGCKLCLSFQHLLCLHIFLWLNDAVDFGSVSFYVHQDCIFSAISHLPWRRNDRNFVIFRPSWIHWLTILALLECRKVHFVFLSCSPLGNVVHKHLEKEWCQLPSKIRFCWLEQSSDWSFASACLFCRILVSFC